MLMRILLIEAKNDDDDDDERRRERILHQVVEVVEENRFNCNLEIIIPETFLSCYFSIDFCFFVKKIPN